MTGKLTYKRGGTWGIFLSVLMVGALLAMNAQAFTVSVVDPTGTPVTGFRWLLEEDNTSVTAPGVPVRVSISTDIHNSHAPVVNSGTEATAVATITDDANGTTLDAAKRYFVSILPNADFSMGGTVVVPDGGVLSNVTVTVNPLPLPTAQISLFAFVDHNPINNIFDEHDLGLGGAKVIIDDTGGQMTRDAFGNPLGTTYQFAGNTPVLNPDGTPVVDQLGTGIIYTLTQEEFDTPGANPNNLRVGEALIKYLVPGKYGVRVVPPGVDDNGAAITWSQTSTIEGTRTVDAWVKANEPPLFVEGFGTGFNHVFYGYVKESPLAPSPYKGQTFTALEWNVTPPAGATGSISGTLRMNHFAKPPELQGYYPGVPVPNCWVGLNDPLVQPGLLLGEAGKYAAPCNADSSFTIDNVPPGTYQLVTWDAYLDTLFGFHTVTVPEGPGGTGEAVDLGEILTFRWFGTLENYVFFDADEDGFWDPGEPGIPEQNVNIRFRDGTIYQAFPTDIDGYVPFDEVFPFFKWLVVEVDFARFKATGMTTAVDDGGPIPGPGFPADGNKNPQPQDPADPFNEYGTIDYRTETGPVLTEAMHLFLGQTNLIEWGKTFYDGTIGENGGISGIVFYAVTRAENDPRYAVGEEWEPGIPRVQVNLYQDMVVNATGLPGNDEIIDDRDGINDDAKDPADPTYSVTLADVDNYPFNWAPMYEFLDDGVTPNPDYDPFNPGPEDTNRAYAGQEVTPGEFNFGDALDITTTDSWDDNKPSRCIQNLPDFGLGPINECADGFGTWNQVRPGVFDGGYAFGPEIDCPGGVCPAWVTQSPGDPTLGYMKPGNYIVEALPPPGYLLVKEEDKNVDFGDTFTPSPLLLPPVCVGDPHQIPEYLSLFPDQMIESPFVWQSGIYVGADPANFRPLCDRKHVSLSTGQNAAADFFFFTEVPKAARAVGFVNNDVAAEFNQASPIFGEKLAAAWIPVAFRDWRGHELFRVYTDEFGGYNAMLPSTYTVNVPSPTGVSPSMITMVLNDPTLPDGSADPFYDPDFAVTPWTFNYTPGHMTYLDTPIIPVAPFTSNEVRLDTGPFDGTPVIYAVATDSQNGPLVCTNTDPGPITLTINAPPGGTVTIRNPDYPTIDPLNPTVTRDVGFGTQGAGSAVTLDGVAQDLTGATWTNTQITLTIPGASSTGRLMVTRDDSGLTSETGVNLNIVDCTGLAVRPVSPSVVVGDTPIQDAVDAAAKGDIILVEPGQYNENVIMDKAVRIQGSGQGSVVNANPVPIDRLQLWHDTVDALGAQEFITFLQKNPFSAGEAPGFFIVGETLYPGGNLQNVDTDPGNVQALNSGNRFDTLGEAAIDGFTISGSKAGGGVFAVSGAYGLIVSNNNITGNQGNFAGGMAVGTPDSGFFAEVDPASPDYPALDGRSINEGIIIRHNKIHRNGGVQGGGGVGLNEGTEGYLVEENLIIGNFGRFNGGGIQHRGYSPGDNIIRGNRIFLNEIFFGALLAGLAGDGAGIYIGGDVAGGTGSGSVTIDGNWIQGNLNGAGYGGGIRAFAVNAQDVRDFPADPGQWFTLDIFNNMIVNNIAAHSGAGISLQDVARAAIINNTIAHNDSTATSRLAFEAGQLNSTPQPAGIASAPHSAILQGLFDAGLAESAFSNPVLVNNTVWENRSFYNDASLNGGAGGLAPNPASPYWDLHVMGSITPADHHMNPDYCILTGLTNPLTGYDYTAGGADPTNSSAAPGFLSTYFNAIESTTVVDEGGNNINVRFTPLAVQGDYHIDNTGQAVNNGSNNPLASFPELATDFDGEGRPFDGVTDVGADEVQSAPAAAPPAPLSAGSLTGETTTVVPAPAAVDPAAGISPVPTGQSSATATGGTTGSGSASPPSAQEPAVTLQAQRPVTGGGGYTEPEEDMNGELVASLPQENRAPGISDAGNAAPLSIREEPVLELPGATAPAEKSYLEITLEELTGAKERMDSAVKNLAAVKNDPASSAGDLSRATDDLVKAAAVLEKAADELAIAIGEVERSLVGSEKKNPQLESAKSALASALEVLAAFEDNQVKENPKG